MIDAVAPVTALTLPVKAAIEFAATDMNNLIKALTKVRAPEHPHRRGNDYGR
jgi:hypothetical protein